MQAAKTSDPEAREQIRACKDPLEAKRLGAKLDFDKEEWKEKSLKVMEVRTHGRREAAAHGGRECM